MKPWQWNFLLPSFATYLHFSAISKSTIMYFCFECEEPSRYNLMMCIANKENFGCKPTNTNITGCLDSYYTTFCTSKHHYSNMSREGYNDHYCKETCAYFKNSYSLQCYFIKLPPTPKVSNFTPGCQYFFGYDKPSYDKYFSIRFLHMATPQGS